LAAGEQLRAQVTQVPDERLVLEPSGRDTLPALVLSMLTVLRTDPEAVVAVLTADHLIDPLASVTATVADGCALAESSDDVLVTFGVVPDSPSTAFGYLETGEALQGDARVVLRFAEKPSLDRAEELVRQGALWNSGMFVWRAATFLEAARAFAPDVVEVVERVAAGEPEAWQQVRRVSVDYGVMEPASTSDRFTVAALPLAARWIDVGSWPQYGDALGRDADGNAVGAGTTALLDSRDCVIASSDPEHLVALVGCEGLVVVHTPRATLVVPASQAQRVKDLHAVVAAHHEELA
ncbi:MAG TPA: sugar phosphate nucleotidyltransferase, partial [Mycobacteriales bacterium]|nr:sugar phosphate nucleotidyltransferase [Mycobacteriales bacterium]